MWSDLHCLANFRWQNPLISIGIHMNLITKTTGSVGHANSPQFLGLKVTSVWVMIHISLHYWQQTMDVFFPINFRILTMVCRGCFNLPPSPLHKLFPWYNIQSKIISVCTIQHSCTLDFPSMLFYFHRQVPVQLWVNITTHLIHTHRKASSKPVPETTQSKPHLQTHTHGNLRWTPSGAQFMLACRVKRSQQRQSRGRETT